MELNSPTMETLPTRQMQSGPVSRPVQKFSNLPAENALQVLRRADSGKKQDLLFGSWDTNRDGYVDFSDIAAGLKKLQPTSEEIHLEFVAEAALKALPALNLSEKKR